MEEFEEFLKPFQNNPLKPFETIGSKSLAKVLVLNTGGTFGFVHKHPGISDEVIFVKGFIETEISSEKYEDTLGLVNKNPDPSFEESKHFVKSGFCKYWIFELDPQIDSADMEMKDWRLFSKFVKMAYDFFDGFVILHGTNTMDFTASAMSFLLKSLTKPVILTGSVIPFSVSGSDAVGNMEGSLILASGKLSVVPEVCIYMDGYLMRGNRTVKVANRVPRPFKSPKCQPFAIRRINGSFAFDLSHVLNRSPEVDQLTSSFNLDHQLCNDIGIIHLFPSIPSSQVKAALDDPTLKGAILIGYGGGYMMQNRSDLIGLFSQASKEREILLVLISQSFPEEPIRREMADTLAEAGILPGHDLTLPAALAKMAIVCSCQTNLSFTEKQRLLSQNWQGEQS